MRMDGRAYPVRPMSGATESFGSKYFPERIVRIKKREGKRIIVRIEIARFNIFITIALYNILDFI